MYAAPQSDIIEGPSGECERPSGNEVDCADGELGSAVRADGSQAYTSTDKLSHSCKSAQCLSGSSQTVCPTIEAIAPPWL